MYELHLSNIERTSTIKNKSKIKFPYGLIIKISENFCNDKVKIKEIDNILSRAMKDPTNLITVEESRTIKENLKKVLLEIQKQQMDSEDLKQVISFLNLAILYKKQIMILTNKLN